MNDVQENFDDHAQEHDHIFARLEGGHSERIHVAAMQLEMSAQFGCMGLDPEQATFLASALRALASIADNQAEGYNAVVEQLEMRMREDEARLAFRAMLRRTATEVGRAMLYGMFIALGVFVLAHL